MLRLRTVFCKIGSSWTISDIRKEVALKVSTLSFKFSKKTYFTRAPSEISYFCCCRIHSAKTASKIFWHACVYVRFFDNVSYERIEFITALYIEHFGKFPRYYGFQSYIFEMPNGLFGIRCYGILC